MKKVTCLIVVIVPLVALLGCGVTKGPVADAVPERGICVLLGDSDGAQALELARSTELLIYSQLEANKEVEAARRAVDAEGYYGSRIWVEKGSFQKIHLADNLADRVIVVGEATDTVGEEEVLRVLCPRGKGFMGSRELTKPPLEGSDDWSHPNHGPDNNTQSEDQVARAPYLTQFLAKPYYAPLTQVAVASAGRVFKAFGNIAFHEREEALLNSLVAFNGYNGTMLWRRKLTPGVMIHRSTMVATPEILYVGDDKSCQMIDAATGQLVDELIPPLDIAGGTFWKWMALENGVLYALIGEQEKKDPVTRQRRRGHGWPWDPLTPGFNLPENPWGFGHDLVAIDLDSKEILWSYHEDAEIDSRALGMKNGRIFIYGHGVFLACLSSENGETVWRKTPDTAPELFAALGPFLGRQGARTNWRTANYMKCGDDALYFAGPTVSKLLAVSNEDGQVLWEHPFNNFQLVLREDGLYGISHFRDEQLSLKFEPLTGEVLAELDTQRRSCTRPNGSVDAIFYRAIGGTVRLDIESQSRQWVSPMRPQCHDGVTIANGLLYWWPSTCDCHNTLYGVTCLGPAGEFDFSQEATEVRLEKGSGDTTQVAPLEVKSGDWPTFRADNWGTATSGVKVSESRDRLWWYTPEREFTPTPPVAVGGMVFFGGSDGIVRAVDSKKGKLSWKAYTGGSIRYPPTVWNGRVFVGSGDGWMYVYEAMTGRLLWRFNAAPMNRKIPVYDSLMSTWPVASGVVLQEGIAYFAAGILNFDGIHVYALDAITGEIKWQNNSSGHLDPQARTGVSVQGHMLIHDGKLYLAGGTSVSPAVYDISDGRCLNDPTPLQLCRATNARGQDLFKIGDEIIVAGKPMYSDPDYPVYDASVFNKVLHSSADSQDVLWINQRRILSFDRLAQSRLKKYVAEPLDTDLLKRRRAPNYGALGKPRWEVSCEGSVALVRSKNAVLYALEAGGQRIAGVDLKTGKQLWRWGPPLQSPVVPWGLAIDRDGRIIATLRDGQVMCFGSTG